MLETSRITIPVTRDFFELDFQRARVCVCAEIYLQNSRVHANRHLGGFNT